MLIKADFTKFFIFYYELKIEWGGDVLISKLYFVEGIRKLFDIFYWYRLQSAFNFKFKHLKAVHVPYFQQLWQTA